MRRVAISLTSALAAGLLVAPADAQTPVGTAFTYQGQLKKNGVPLDGPVDLRVIMWDAPVGGTATGTLVTTREAVKGLIEFRIDFGDAPFDGTARWLEVSVRHPSGIGSFTLLEPRQELRPTPYAIALPGLRTQQNGISPNLIGGLQQNSVEPGVVGAVIGGGGEVVEDVINSPNRVTDDYGVVSGGFDNVAGDIDGSVGTATAATVSGGKHNNAGATNATVGGGTLNTASGVNTTIAGGVRNTATAYGASVGGGHMNDASGSYAVVPGGDRNAAGGYYSFAAGNHAKVRDAAAAGDLDGDEGTFVWADSTTPSGEHFTSTGPNQFLIRATGGVGINTNNPANALSVAGTADFSGRVGIGTTTPGATFLSAKLEVSGGHIAIANDHGVFSSTSAGGAIGAGFDTGTDDALDLWAGGAKKLRITPGGDVGIGTTGPASRLHSVDTQAGSLTYPLRLTNAGGSSDTAVGMLFHVDEGANRGKGAIVYERTGSWNRGDFHILQNIGSNLDVADLDDAVMTIKSAGWIGMGTVAPAAQLDVTSNNTNWTGVNIKNLASNQRYLIQVNGTQPGATRAGNLEVWGTSATANYNVLTATPTARLGIGRTDPAYPLQVGTNGTNGNGAHLTAGGMWVNGSDRESKCGFEKIDNRAILAKVAALAVSKWRYKGEDDGVRHIGPVAQDFYDAFGVGESDKHIGTIDADGVALAAIQGLHEMSNKRDAEIEALRNESASLRARLEQLETVLAKLSASREGDAQ